MGRPPKTLNAHQITQLESLAAFCNLDQIADYFGMSDTTLHRRMKEDPNVLKAYKRGRAQAAAKVGQSLLQQALDGNLTAAIFYAKTQMGWREVQQIDANVTQGSFVLDLVKDPDDAAGDA